MDIHCEFINPDCMNCPYEDCIATTEDIFRQNSFRANAERAERNRKIVKMRMDGYKMREIAERFKMNIQTVSTIVRIEGRKAHG